MSSLKEVFDILVVGDEPAAHWWMDKAFSYTKGYPKDGKRQFSVPKICHISVNKRPRLPLPHSIAHRFGFPIGETKQVEFIYPEGLRDSLPFSLEFSPDSPFVSTLENLKKARLKKDLQNTPQLLAMAQGLWRTFGRTDHLLPETYLWNAFQLLPYSFWQASSAICDPNRVTHSLENLLQNRWLRFDSNGNFEVELSTGAVIVAKELILGLDIEELEMLRTSCPDLAPLLPDPKTFLSETALFRLEIENVEPVLLSQLKDLSLYFIDSHLPAPEEIYTLDVDHKQHTISLDFVSKFDFSLEEVSTKARKAYEDLLTLIPDLSKTAHHIRLPLDAANEEESAEREKAFAAFRRARIPRFCASTSNSRTLHPHLHLLAPFINCHLAYPFGPLEAARKHLAEFFGKTRFKKGSAAVEGAAFFS